MKEKFPFFLGFIIMGNLYLLFLIFQPIIDETRRQVEESSAVLTAVDEPLYHDYYFDYRYEGTKEEKEWNVEVYKEVKVLLDQNGVKMAEVPTGRWEYLRVYRDTLR